MKLLVVGDWISDRYIFGTAVRLCPEAPVPVVIPQIERTSPGGVGLVVEQLRELGAEVHRWFGSNSFKQRIFVGSHLVCRLDRDGTGYNMPRLDLEEVAWADAIVVSDYGKGAMTEGLAHKLVGTGKPLFVDAKHHWDWYEGATIFPNEHELVGGGFYRRIVRKLGAKGCSMSGTCTDPAKIALPATVTEVVDTTGAGDIFMAGFVYAWTLQLPAEDCLRFANSLAGESCRHVGTYVVPKEFAQEVLGRLRASTTFGQLAPDCSPGSTMSEKLQRLESAPGPTSLIVEKFGIPLEDLVWDQADSPVFPRNPQPAQTPLKSPLDPTVSPGAPLPTDQESSDEQDRRLR